MRILHVFHHYKPCLGGVEKVIEELNKAMKAKGHISKVLCLDSCPGGRQRLAKDERFEEAIVERIRFIDLGVYKLAPFGLGKLKGFDVVHVHGLGFFADFLALTKPFHRKPLVLSTHGGIFHTKRLSFLKKAYFLVWCRLLLRAFDAVVAVSRQDRALFGRIAGGRAIELIENGVEWKKLGGIKRSPEKNFFLCFGRLGKNKGLEELLEAFSVFRKRTESGRLLVAGEDTCAIVPGLKRKAKSLGIEASVSFLGRVSDEMLCSLMSKAEFFVSASKYEGFGITAVEAMAAGMIPLLNRIEAFENFVTDGKNGFLIDFDDREKAGLQMEKAAGLSSAEKLALGRSARDFASGFDWAEKALEYEAVYRRAAKR